jgi:hypothetical protein
MINLMKGQDWICEDRLGLGHMGAGQDWDKREQGRARKYEEINGLDT